MSSLEENAKSLKPVSGAPSTNYGQNDARLSPTRSFPESTKRRAMYDTEAVLSKRQKSNYDSSNNNNNNSTHAAISHVRVQRRLSRDDYTVGWVCALHIEMAAAEAMLDEKHACQSQNPDDPNAYVFGRIGQHDIVIACLPAGEYGTNNAATVAANMQRSFPRIHIRLMVGIAGGAPGQADIRLGDVVVSTRVVQYDLGKTIQNGQFLRTAHPRIPPDDVLTAVNRLRARHEQQPTAIPQILSDMHQRNPYMSNYQFPHHLQDKLFDSSYDHNSSMQGCVYCDKARVVQRPPRSTNCPKIHVGGIASGNQVMRHGKSRDDIAQKLGVLCFEMEAAGLMNTKPFLIIRGICDYSDSHKDKQWQKYAAATAAAYAKELLSDMPQCPADPGLIISAPSSSQDLRHILMNALSFEQIDSRYSMIKTAYDRTCMWLLKHPAYEDWLDPKAFNQHHGFLWVKGKPGAGKSTLMKFAYSHALKHAVENEHYASFFFNARGDEIEKSTIGMYRSLLLQMLTKMPDLQQVLQLCPRDQHSASIWTIKLLRQLFSAAITGLGNRRMVFFIDALDEGDEDEIRDMVSYFEDLGQNALENGSKLYICLSSRHYPTILIQGGREFILEDEHGHDEDLTNYVRNRLRAGKSKMVNEIQTEIMQKANGVFLWVILVIDILNDEYRRGRIFAVERRLREIPAGLGDLFKDMLRRDATNLPDLLLCIQWILFAKRPLTREEFYFALVAGLTPHPKNLEWDPERITTEDMDRFVINSSKGLAELTKTKRQTVQFIHEAVRDFLLKDGGLYELWPELGRDLHSLSHEQLKQCCHAYLKVNMTDSILSIRQLPPANSDAVKHLRETIRKKFPFLEYSVCHVLFHADQAAIGLPQDQFLASFSLEGWIKTSNLFERYTIRRHSQDATILYILAENNYARLINIKRYCDSGTERTAWGYQDPIFAAVENGHQDAVEALLNREDGSAQLKLGSLEIVKVLLEEGANAEALNATGDTPLHWSMQTGNYGLLKLLLEEGANIEAFNAYGDTPLHWTIQKGDHGLLKFLLEKGASVEASGRGGQTPLEAALGSRREAFIRLLAKHGADLDRDSGRGTLLRQALAQNCEEIAVTLVELGAKVEVRDLPKLFLMAVTHGITVVARRLAKEGANLDPTDPSVKSAFGAAVSLGNFVAVQLFLEYGAEVNRPLDWGIPALNMAVRYSGQAIVRLLLESGADLDATCDTHETALMTAVRYKDEASLRLLLSHGANVNIRSASTSIGSEPGETALMIAVKQEAENFVELLLQYGADVNCTDRLGSTALMNAARKGSKAIVVLLLKYAADINVANFSGQTALLCATLDFTYYPQKEAIIRLLLDQGADVNVRDNQERTALTEATSKMIHFQKCMEMYDLDDGWRDYYEQRKAIVQLLQT